MNGERSRQEESDGVQPAYNRQTHAVDGRETTRVVEVHDYSPELSQERSCYDVCSVGS
jgi:hypothetical protein